MSKLQKNNTETEVDKLTFEQISKLSIAWGKEKGISDTKTQALKMVSEVGELCDNVAKGNVYETRDDIGDTFVTLVILAELLGHDPVECFEEAYNVIAPRTGKMVNGTFVKDE